MALTCPIWCSKTCANDPKEPFHNIDLHAEVSEEYEAEQVGVELSRQDGTDGPGEVTVDITYANRRGRVVNASVPLTPVAARRYALAILNACDLATQGADR